MVSPAHIDDQKQYLVLAEEDTTPNRTLSAGESVATGLSENELFDNVSAFYYNDRVRITFLASEKFKPDFSLIRGLLEFNRPRNLMFTYDRHATSVSIDLAKDYLTNLDGLLTNVRNWLVKEKLFRKALRTVIEFEKHYQQGGVRGDPNKLRIVVDNLLSNATKYTPDGGRIRVSLRAAGSCAVLDVEDTGPGIDESEIETVFEPFQQGSAECSASVKGTGLGLAIAKEYAEAHDGNIGVVGSARGAHVRVSIPIAGPQGQRTISRARVVNRLPVSV